MFNDLPRYCGFPHQIWVERPFALNSFFTTFNGKAPFFVSTYKFVDRITPIVDSMIFDIDSYFGLRIPYKNTKSLKSWCENHNMPYIINLSGGKGFHFFLMVKPVIPKTDEEKDKLRDLIYSVQDAIVKECNIGALDPPTMGRLHWLIRYPTSKYVRMNDEGVLEGNGFYCRNLTPEEFDKGLKYIGKIAKEPGIIPEAPKGKHTIDEIARMLPNFKLKHRQESADNISIVRAGMTVPTVEALGLPCLKEIVKHSHPTHPERMELVAFMKFMGYRDLAIIQFIKERNWTRHDDSKTRYQVSTIKPRYPRCTDLRKSYGHLCKECPLKRRIGEKKNV